MSASAKISTLSGWGRAPVVPGVELHSEDLRALTGGKPLSRGLGRSYGDSSLPAPGDAVVASTTLADPPPPAMPPPFTVTSVPSGSVAFVPAENLVGRAEFIFFSTDGAAAWWEVWKWPVAIRYGRLFTAIR